MKRLFLKTIKFYQFFISPILGPHCRFYPSCSEYTKQSIQKYGLLSGSWRGFKRILKCHPYHSGGVDLP
ncbi:MAG: membrane protein insertion efficiency factor YidD [Candidatus Nealsonbacteria bacterium]|nr:MAG: membrane protein insertion efficiency factor YidD [Candidatus Nealsonbacteria bacterium]